MQNLVKQLATQMGEMQEFLFTKGGLQFVELADIFMVYFNFRVFRESLDSTKNQNLKEMLKVVFSLFGYVVLLPNQVSLFENQIITSEQVLNVGNLKLSLYERIMLIFLDLLDAFQYEDKFLGSLIGGNQGNPYELIMDYTQNVNSLNKYQPNGYDQLVKEMRKIPHSRL